MDNQYSSGFDVCPCCDGKGWQIRISDGIKITCPACGGSGIKIPDNRILWGNWDKEFKDFQWRGNLDAVKTRNS